MVHRKRLPRLVRCRIARVEKPDHPVLGVFVVGETDVPCAVTQVGSIGSHGEHPPAESSIGALRVDRDLGRIVLVQRNGMIRVGRLASLKYATPCGLGKRVHGRRRDLLEDGGELLRVGSDGIETIPHKRPAHTSFPDRAQKRGLENAAGGCEESVHSPHGGGPERSTTFPSGWKQHGFRRGDAGSARRGSNPRPPAWEADALPLSYARKRVRAPDRATDPSARGRDRTGTPEGQRVLSAPCLPFHHAGGRCSSVHAEEAAAALQERPRSESNR